MTAANNVGLAVLTLCRLGAAATSPGSEYEAAEMESGRTVNVTLHRCSAPGAQQQEMAGGGSGPLHMVLCSTLLPDGSTRVRVLLFSEQVSGRSCTMPPT